MKSRKYNKSYRKTSIKKNKTTRRIHKQRIHKRRIHKPNTRSIKGGAGKIPPHQYLFFDREHFPISPAHLNTLIHGANMTPDFELEGVDIRRGLKIDDEHRGFKIRKSSIIYLVDPSIRTIFGYVEGYIHYDIIKDKWKLYISSVELLKSIRGLGFCVPMLDNYVKNVLANNPDIEIKTAELYNIGGEYACRCYKKVFEMNGFSLRRDIDCLSEDRDELMVFHKN